MPLTRARGRLWLICPKCRRWNLAPLLERWEPVEECEKAFRELRERVHTDEIGAARHPSGLKLVRVGDPLPIEFATWRYSDIVSGRRRRMIVKSVAGTVIAVGAVGAGSLTGALPGAVGGMLLGQGPSILHTLDRIRGRVVLALPDGRVVKLKETQIDLMNPREAGLCEVRLRMPGEELVVGGPEARRVAAKAFPHVNRFGASRRLVADAAKQLEECGGGEELLKETWGKGRRRPGGTIPWEKRGDRRGASLFGLEPATRLAAEMALHEERERRAMEGELFEMKRAWEEAEALAKISDDLLLPEGVLERLEQLRTEASA